MDEGFAMMELADASFLKSVMDQVSDIVLIVDPDMNILYANQTASAAYGYSANEFRLLKLQDLQGGNAADNIEARLKTVLQAGIRFGSTHLRKSREQFPVEISVLAVHISGRESFVIIIQELISIKETLAASTEKMQPRSTELLAVDQSPGRCEERCKLAVEEASDGLWEYDPINDRFYYSEKLAEILGIAPNQTLTLEEYAIQAVAPEYLPVMHSAVVELMEGRTPCCIFEYCLNRPQGICWLHVRGKAVYGDDGRPIRIAGSVIDITGRKEMELELKSKNEQLEVLNQEMAELYHQAEGSKQELRVRYERLRVVEEELRISRDTISQAARLAHLGPWEYDSETGIFKFNDEFYAIYCTDVAREGSSMDPAVYAREFLHPDDSAIVAKELKQGILSGESGFPRQFEHRIIRRDGEVRTIVVRLNIIRNADGKIVKWYGVNQDVTEQIQAEEKLRQQNEYLNSLHETSRGLLNQLDLDDLLQALLNHACELFGTAQGYIYWVNEQEGLLETRVGMGIYANSVGRYTLKIGQGVGGRVVQTGRPFIVEDYHNWPESVSDTGWEALSTVVGIPLKSGEKVIGVIGLGYLDRPRSFSEDEVMLLGRFAELASLAAANARLYTSLAAAEADLQKKNEDLMGAHEELTASEEELRQQVSELVRKETEIYRQNFVLSSLHEISIGLLDQLELDQLLKSLVTRACDLFGTSDGFIMMVDEEREVLQLMIGVGRFADYQTIFKPGEGVVGKVWQSGKPLTVENYSKWSGRVRDSIFDTCQISACTPLKSNKKVIGVAGLGFFGDRSSFSREETELFGRFAELASVALVNARLHGTLTESEKALRNKVAELITKEEKIRQQNTLLTSLHETTLALIKRFTLNEVLRIIVDSVTALLGTPNGFVLLDGEEEGFLTLEVASGIHAGKEGWKVKTTEGLVGIVYSSGKIAAISNYNKWENRLSGGFFNNIEYFAEAPLKSGDNVVGVLGLTYPEPGRTLAADELVLLQRFAELASIAIDNARLYDSMQSELTKRKIAQEALAASEEKFSKAFRYVADVISIIRLSDGKCIEINDAFSQILGYSRDEVIGRTSEEINLWHSKDDRERCYEKLNRGENISNFETVWCTKSGEARIGLTSAEVIEIGGERCLVSAWHDITERKWIEEQLRYCSIRDALTGLYNRTHFEEQLARLQEDYEVPVAVIVFDADGLKLVNDAWGHASGDKLLIVAADIIRCGTREGDIAARVGGDEFAIILPEADEQVARSVLQRINSKITAYNDENPSIPISLSIGYSVREKGETTFLQDVVREADNHMYREKLLHSQSAHSNIIQTLMKVLEERDFVTEEHAERLQGLASKLAGKLNLPESRIAGIRLFAQFHDIGKVGISDHILKKPGSLTEEEKQEMQRHCEIGYRIAQSSNNLLPIALWILKHQEWWDGNGYPLGIRGEEIPLECRILAIVDAYDAMTSDRPYRKAMSREAAVEELKRCAGTQFDPTLVDKFVSMNIK